MFRSTLLATLVVTGACVAESDSSPTGGGSGGKADGDLATIVFDVDWNETVVDGPLVAGRAIRVDYDLDRLNACRGSTNGSEVWGVTGYASFDGAPAQTFGVSRLDSGGRVRPVTAEIEIPSGTERVAMWFSISNRWGCIAYDSNDSANYDFAVETGAGGATGVLSFDADWSETFDRVAAGDTVIVHYDPSRLAECAGSSGGYPQWSVTGYYQVDGGAVRSLAVTRADGAELVAADPSFVVPGGRDLALWFEATNRWGCHAYDSEYGANYHVAIE
jgi:hypothetical protein